MSGYDDRLTDYSPEGVEARAEIPRGFIDEGIDPNRISTTAALVVVDRDPDGARDAGVPALR